MKKLFTVNQLIEKAVSMGCNRKEATKTIKGTYHWYVEYRNDYSIKKAAMYCMYYAPCSFDTCGYTNY